MNQSILRLFCPFGLRRVAARSNFLREKVVEPGAGLADLPVQTKKPRMCEAFIVWYQRPDSNRHAFKGGGF